MEFLLLGPLEVRDGDRPIPLGGAKQRALLAFLLLHTNEVVSRDRLIDGLWGGQPPATAAHTVETYVSRLRRGLHDVGSHAALVTRPPGYVLRIDPEELDLTRFRRLAGDGRRALAEANPELAADLLRRALALFRGPPLDDVAFFLFAQAEVGGLEEMRLAALEDRIEADLAAGRRGELVGELDALVSAHPLRERLQAQLMLALYRAGRQADALEAYRAARRHLAEELGVEPAASLRRLEQAILEHDASLEATATGPERVSADTVAAGPRRPCPYRGLARYEVGDADLFVGRERLVDELVARLVDERLLVAVGPSGAGKSSLVRAGLVSALAGGALPGSAGWSVAVVQPGTEPLEVLAGALAPRPDVLVVDQAEEALLADGGSCLGAFGDRVLEAAGDGTRVVLVLRSDFFGLLAGHSALARRAGPATVLVGSPDERELRRIITEPAVRVGLRVEPALTDLIVGEVRDRPGVLPVLSTALVRAWEHRDGDLLSLASYRAGGGVVAALERVGEEAWAGLEDDAQRSACRRLLLRLAADEDGSWIRRWARRSELAGPDDPAAAAALAVLTSRRLVVARADDLGIAHEALLTGWPRLHGWLEDGRSRAAVRERLAIAATAWEESEHDPAELYRGTRLQAALDTAAASPEDLTPLERKFLAESADEADRQLADQRARADKEARGRRRARLVAAGLAVALTFAASAGVYAITKQRQADTRQRQAERAALAADASRLGALARAGGDYDRSLLLAAQAVTLNPSPTTESDLFATLLRGDAVLAVLRAPGEVWGTTFTPDERSVLAATRSGQVVRWSTRGGPIEASFDVGQNAGGVAVASDGRLVVLAEQTLEMLDPKDGRVLEHGPEIGLDVWSLVGGGRVVVAAAPAPGYVSPTDILLWRLGPSHAKPQRIRIGDAAVRVAPCAAQTACVLTESGRLIRIRLANGTVEGSVELPPGTLDSLAASPDGHTVAVANADGIVRLVDARTGHVARELGGASKDARVLTFSPDGSRVAASDFATGLVWRTDRRGLPERYDVHGGQVRAAAWSRDGSTLATGSADGTVVLSDTTGRRRVGAVLSDALGDDTSTLWAVPRAIVVAQFGGRLLFINPSSGAIHPAEGDTGGTDQVITARAGRSGTLLVTADLAGVTAVWDVKTRHLLGTVDLPRARQPYSADVWVSPDGTRAATIRSRAGPVVFDPVTRRVIRHLGPLPPPVGGLNVDVQGWTPDGRSILITRQLSTSQSDLLVLDAATGAVKLRVSTGAAWAQEATADPTGRFIALGMTDGTLRILDAKNGRALAPPLRANEGQTINVSVSPDGRYIATSGRPPRLTVWDTRTFRQVGVPLPLDVNALDARARFAPDGRLVVTSGPVLRVFTIDPAKWLARACREAGRTLTRAEFEEVLPGRPYRPACV
jgi:DNA-binding SARP family transcriptional activator/WD40 repeat protein